MLMTVNPTADAERYNDARFADQDAHEAMVAEAEQQAPLIVLAQLQALTRPGDWFRAGIAAGGLHSPDELLCEAINEDDATKDRIAELMTSPAAQQVRQAMAEWFGRKYSLAICQDSTEHH